MLTGTIDGIAAQVIVSGAACEHVGDMHHASATVEISQQGETEVFPVMLPVQQHMAPGAVVAMFEDQLMRVHQGLTREE